MRVFESSNSGPAGYWRFLWPRQKSYELRQIETAKGWMEVIGSIDDNTAILYYPLDESPGISRGFSEIRTSDDALAFANKYGLLGLELVVGSPEPEATAIAISHGWKPAQVHVGEESLSLWLYHAARLRYMYLLWDAIDSNDTRGLSTAIRYWPDAIQNEEVRATAFPPDRWKKGELIRFGKLRLLEIFNHVLDGMASPTLLMDAAGDLRPYTAPTSLLAAIWLEFGEVVCGVRKQIVCESCGKVMDVTGNRSHKRKHDACSLREKMARYRKKIKEQEDGKAKAR